MTQKQFVVGVADAFLIDKTTNQLVLKGKAMLNTAIQQTVSNTEIAGGEGNKLLFDWCYGKRMSATLEAATWNEEYLALSNGTSIVSGLADFYVLDEPVTLTAGTGTLTQVPTGDLYVQKADGTNITVTPTSSTFSVSGGAATTVLVTYRTNTSINQIVIAPDEYPVVYELVLKSSIKGPAGKVADIEIVIPQFKPNGGHDITFGATAASTSKMDGKALAYTTANGREVYAYVNIKPAVNTTSFIGLSTSPSVVSLSTVTPTSQLLVIAVQGGLRSNVVVTAASAGTTYVSSTPATATVSANGLITRVASGSTTITITNGSLTDTVNVTCS